MNMEGPSFPVFESADAKLKNEINAKLSELLKKGTPLADIVELLDAQEFLEYIEPGKKQSPVAHFDVDGFIKKRTSENRKFSLPEEYIKIDETILPPSEMEIRSGDGTGFKEAGIIPRSTMLMETLTEMGLKYSVIEGQNDPKMVRKLSYLIFAIPSMQKLVLVNDEEANATFIIHKAQPEEWKNYIKKTKDELYAMSRDLISSIIYPNKNKEKHQERWKDKIKKLLINGALESDIIDSAIIGNTESIPEDWLSLLAVSKKIGVDPMTAKRYAEEHRTICPDHFKQYITKKGLTKIYYSPKLVEILFNEYGKIESAPRGWQTAESLHEIINNGIQTIKKFVENYRAEHPIWFRLYKNSIGRRMEYYHPELVDVIIEEFEKIKSIPDGWSLAYDLAKKIDVAQGTISKHAKEYRLEHSEWFKIFRSQKGSKREYFSPELVKIISDKHKQFKSVPENWTTVRALTKELNISITAIRRYAEKYRSEHPEWFKFYENHLGLREMYYHPDLIKLIHNNFEDDETLPDGWISLTPMMKILKGDFRTVKRYLENYKADHPEWFKNYKDIGGRMREYYSPELVETMKKDYALKPTDWIVMASLTKNFKRDRKTIRDIMRPYRISNSDWFRNYRGSNGMITEHYSPELIEIIKNELCKDKDSKN